MNLGVFEKLHRMLQDEDFRREYGASLAKTELALILAEARQSRELSQRDMAELAKVSQAYIAKLESGEANPTIGQVGSMLALLWLRPAIRLERLEQRGVQLPASRGVSASPGSKGDAADSTIPFHPDILIPPKFVNGVSGGCA